MHMFHVSDSKNITTEGLFQIRLLKEMPCTELSTHPFPQKTRMEKTVPDKIQFYPLLVNCKLQVRNTESKNSE